MPELDPVLPSYTTAEAARLLDVSIPTIQRWIDRGRLKGWKTLGGHRRVDAASVAVLLGSHAKGSAGTPDATAPSVLVVEDDAIDRELLCNLVCATWPDARMSTAPNGFEALLVIGRDVPDIVLSDIVMPHMDGLEMMRQLAGSQHRQPRLLVAVSSLKPAQLHKMGGLPPRVLFIAKPVEPKIAIAALASAWQQVR